MTATSASRRSIGEIELSSNGRQLENELLKKQIALLEKSQEYRCCPVDEDEGLCRPPRADAQGMGCCGSKRAAARAAGRRSATRRSAGTRRARRCAPAFNRGRRRAPRVRPACGCAAALMPVAGGDGEVTARAMGRPRACLRQPSRGRTQPWPDRERQS